MSETDIIMKALKNREFDRVIYFTLGISTILIGTGRLFDAILYYSMDQFLQGILSTIIGGIYYFVGFFIVTLFYSNKENTFNDDLNLTVNMIKISLRNGWDYFTNRIKPVERLYEPT